MGSKQSKVCINKMKKDITKKFSESPRTQMKGDIKKFDSV